MDDLLNSIPISEDDVVVNLNYQILFTADDAFDPWIQESILNSLKKYGYKNAIRLNKVDFLTDSTISFRIKQLNPDIAPQEIIDDMEKTLKGLLNSCNADSIWKEIASFTVGDQKEVKNEIAQYLKKLRKGQ